MTQPSNDTGRSLLPDFTTRVCTLWSPVENHGKPNQWTMIVLPIGLPWTPRDCTWSKGELSSTWCPKFSGVTRWPWCGCLVTTDLPSATLYPVLPHTVLARYLRAHVTARCTCQQAVQLPSLSELWTVGVPESCVGVPGIIWSGLTLKISAGM